jgi:hypothetical protein
MVMIEKTRGSLERGETIPIAIYESSTELSYIHN